MDLPDTARDPVASLDDFALIDEISGLTTFLDDYMKTNPIPEHIKDRIRSRMFRYEGEKPKEIALNEMREVMFGAGRWKNSCKNFIYLNS